MNRPLQNAALRAAERFIKAELEVRQKSYGPNPLGEDELNDIREARNALTTVQRAIVDAELHPDPEAA